MIVVSDTTPLNYLILIEAVHVLPAIFGRVHAPSTVLEELLHPKSPEAVRAWASSPPDWLTVQDPGSLDPSPKLHAGESAAISLALELGAGRILIDERKGYRAALQRGLRAVTTLGILEEASYRGLIDSQEMVGRLDKETTFFVTDEVIEEFRRRVREAKQTQERAVSGQSANEQETKEDLKHGRGSGLEM